MAYSAGRMEIYLDLETAQEDYTTATFDSMTVPAVNQICNILGMVILNNLTIETDRGHRYFIGFNGETKPRMAIGWCAKNTHSTAFFLEAVAMFDGDYLNDGLDRADSRDPAAQYCVRLAIRSFGDSNYNHNYINYIKSENLCGFSHSYNSSSSTATSNNRLHMIVVKQATNKLTCYAEDRNDYWDSFDYYKNGMGKVVIPGTSFNSVKNLIANSDLNYIVQLRLDHDQYVTGLYIYSANISSRIIYLINGEYYYCMYGSSEGSAMMKLPDYNPT